MEFQRTQTITDQPNISSFDSTDSSCNEIEERLNSILAANAEIKREKQMFRTFREQTESEMMRHPIPVKKVFSYFGLMLGTFPPAAIFLKMLQPTYNADSSLVILFLFVNLICAVVGYFSGKLIGKMVLEMENHSWHFMLITLPFIGILWGMITGGAGGILVFVIGAFFGAIIASMVGSVAVTSFAVFHRLLKKGEMIERNQFLPLAFGITFVISAFILGL